MKIKNKIISVSIIFMLLSYLFPLISSAREYSLSGTDISINFDDTEWYVFTRDNLLNNPELDELNISYDYLNNFMMTNSVYLDAIIFLSDSSEDYIESFVRINKINEVNTLENASREELLEVAKGIANTVNSNDYDIYTNEYNFIELNYTAQGLFFNEYYTIINGYTYVITFQKPSSFTIYDQLDIKLIIDSIDFYIDPNKKNNVSQSTDFDWEEIGEEAFISGIAAIIISIVSYFFNKGEDKKNNNIKEKKYNNKKNSSIWKTIGIIILSFISSEMILMLILGNTIVGTSAFLLVCVVTIPFYYLYKFIFRKRKQKKSVDTENKIVWIKCNSCGKTIPNNNNEICEECQKKVLEYKNNVNEDVAPINAIANNEIVPIKNGNTSKARYICLSNKNEDYVSKGNFDIRGKDVKLVKKESIIYCTNCGKKVEETWKHCKYCGEEIK